MNPRGESVVFGDSAPLIVTKLEGVGTPKLDIQTQKSPYQDGTTYIASFLNSRSISIEGALLGQSRENVFAIRRMLVAVLNPKRGPGTLRYEYDGGVKEITAVPETGPTFIDSRCGTYRKFVVDFLCPNPFWLDPEGKTEELTAFDGGLTFPLHLPNGFADESPSKSKIIANEGDVETPVEITFFGPATKPIRIQNDTTGEFVEVKQSLFEGEQLVVQTEFGKKSVTKVDASGVVSNAFHYIENNSIFFQLIEGNNKISYSTGYEYERSPVQVKWRERFLGV
ncbi:phage tail family protein [Brevibacillus choshinensis]|uniref:phage tail family protein n=1 Tax=Brevibacillus choshinensis TaxID=54911 RepID=UPI001EEE6F4E|nr:phage tail family protein [Brevibacillus choshinensis]